MEKQVKICYLNVLGDLKCAKVNKKEKMEDSNDESNLVSTTSTERDTQDIYIEDVQDPSSITTVLNYCKTKILNPYLRLLSFMGLRPLFSDQREPSVCTEIISYAYVLQVIVFMILGYFLQYMACFRRERGFGHIPDKQFTENTLNAVYEQTCSGSIVFSFVLPSVLHFVAYLHALLAFRSEDDQLPVLMERVFISSSNLSHGFISQKKLVKILWLFIIFSILWMLCSLASVNYMMTLEDINFQWIEIDKPSKLIAMKILLIICTLWHDIIQATVISNYCLQAQLLTSYVQFMKEKLLQYPVAPIEWMRDIEDFRKLLNFFNDQIAPSVCLFTIVNISYAVSGILWTLKLDHIDKEILPLIGISGINITLWIVISIAPFIQASRLSNACDLFKTVGHEVRTRPFVHQDTPVRELDSILLYTSTLDINAKLFKMPINGKYLSGFITFITVFFIVLGQMHFLNF